MSKILLRVRTKAGTWRLPDCDVKNKISDIISRIEKEQSVTVKKVSLKQNLSDEVPKTKTLSQLGLKNGAMIFVEITGGVIVVGDTRRELDEKGNIKSPQVDKNGFLPGLKALKDQKQKWTLTEMTELQDKYQFKITGTKKDLCAIATLDTSACQNFVQYISTSLQYKQCRCGILFGKYIDSETEKERKKLEEEVKLRNEQNQKRYGSNKQNMTVKDLEEINKFNDKPKHAVVVHSIYEPPQTNTPGTFTLLEDGKETSVKCISESLGLQVVGFIVTHPKTDDYILSSHEIITAAELSLESSNGERNSPFVVVRVVLDQGHNVSFEAFSLTETCLDMVAEGAVAVLKENLSHCKVVEPFTAIVEAKEAHVIDNDFFIKSVPIANFISPLAETVQFPRMNRVLTPTPSQKSMKEYVRSLLGNNIRNLSDLDLEKLLSNFHVLLYVSEVFTPGEGLSDICIWLRKRIFEQERKEKFPEGYKLMLLNMAGLD